MSTDGVNFLIPNVDNTFQTNIMSVKNYNKYSTKNEEVLLTYYVDHLEVLQV